jgi:predicted TIM-barrel fold metal-dependent hydrolase
MDDLIDAHSHVWTPDTARYPLASGYAKDQIQPPSFTPEEFFAHARPEGVRRVVLIQMSFYGTDNRYMVDCMRHAPGVFGGVAVVDVTATHPDTEMKRLAKSGVRGFRIDGRIGPPASWLETPGLDRMFRCAADHGLAICPLMEPSGLPSLSRMCVRHPQTRVVIDHLCRIGIDGTIREADVAALCALAQYPEVRVKVSAFYALGAKKPPHDDLLPLIRRVHAAFGARRLMWASDCPFQVSSETYRDSIALVRERCHWLTDEDREWLLRKTAAEVFFA